MLTLGQVTRLSCLVTQLEEVSQSYDDILATMNPDEIFLSTTGDKNTYTSILPIEWNTVKTAILTLLHEKKLSLIAEIKEITK